MRDVTFRSVTLAVIAILGGVTVKTTTGSEPFEIEWGTTYAASEGSDSGNSVAVDGAGNIYIAGTIRDSLSLESRADGVLLKYDPSGSLLWARELAARWEDAAYGVAVDESGYAIVTGRTNGALAAPNAGGYDAFVARYDPLGTQMSISQFGGFAGDGGYSVNLDHLGNAYVAGYSEDGLGTGSYDNGGSFVRKLDPSGNVLWSQVFGADGDRLRASAIDNDGNMFLTGHSWAGGGATTPDMFLTKVNPDGALVWSQRFGSPDRDFAESVAVDSKGNAYVTGYREFYENAVWGFHSFLVKFDSTGEPIPEFSVGTQGRHRGQAVAIDELDGVVLLTMAWGNSGQPVGPTSYLARYDASGVQTLDQPLVDLAEYGRFSSLTFDDSGNAYLTGWIASSGADIRLVKLSPVPEPFRATHFLLGVLSTCFGLRVRRNMPRFFGN